MEGEVGGLGLCCVTRPQLGLCRGTVRSGLCTRMSGTCVTCVTCATMTWRGRGGGFIGCAATRVVTWVSSFEPAKNTVPNTSTMFDPLRLPVVL